MRMILDRFRLDGRVALVTGATKGLGRSMATGFAQAGAQIAVVSRHADEAKATAAALQAVLNQPCRGYAADVTDAAQVAALVAQVVADFSRIDILVNNAGVNRRGAIEHLTLDEFEEVYALNVRGPWLMCRAVGPHFKAQRHGRVINLGSMLSTVGMAERTPYAASKGAILQMTRALALEWATFGVTVNAILPGPFATEMNQALIADPEISQAFVAKIPLQRWGEVEEIQGLALFFASDASSFVTGAAMPIDGGWTAQ